MQQRAVLVGCGQMANGWIKALGDAMIGERVRLVGLVDPVQEAAAHLQTTFGLTSTEIHTDLLPALSSLSPDIVFDVAIPDARLRIVTESLRRGCHVLTEKPMAISLADAGEINRAAAAAGRIHAVTQNRRFKTGIRRARATVQSGILGQLTALHCDFFIGAHFGGFRDEMAECPAARHGDPHLRRGALHVRRGRRWRSIASETNPRGSWYAHGAAANAIFEFTDDVAFTYRGSWCAEGANTSWESAWRIIGTRGTLLWDGDDELRRARRRRRRRLSPAAARELEVPPPADAAQTHGHASVIADFPRRRSRAERAPETVGTDNIKSLAMVFAAIESARTRHAPSFHRGPDP